MLTKYTLTILEVAKALNVTRQTVYKEINEGRLKTFKIGRRRLITPDALLAYIAQCEENEAKLGHVHSN